MEVEAASPANTLTTLIHAAYSGSVFGRGHAFPEEAISKMDLIQKQIQEIGLIFTTELQACIHAARPELSQKEIQEIIKEIGPKAVAFCPALTAGELTGPRNVQRLGAAASAIGVMYFADQSMDRGDELMAEAVERLHKAFPGTASKEVADRIHALGYIHSNIDRLARPEDAPIVLDCFNQQVLQNEVVLHKMSLEYMQLKAENTEAFLAANAAKLANLMVIDAGFPSVTTVLYAIYRQNDPSLLPLSQVHRSSSIKKLLQICNTVVRIADEVGDWEIDAGKHPRWGVFSINPLNQYHPDIVTRFCELAYINNDEVRLSLQNLFRDFHTNPEKYGNDITTLLFNHVRDYINNLTQAIQTTHSLYITLCKRVLEIGLVNTVGDRALADQKLDSYK